MYCNRTMFRNTEMKGCPLLLLLFYWYFLVIMRYYFIISSVFSHDKGLSFCYLHIVETRQTMWSSWFQPPASTLCSRCDPAGEMVVQSSVPAQLTFSINGKQTVELRLLYWDSMWSSNHQFLGEPIIIPIEKAIDLVIRPLANANSNGNKGGKRAFKALYHLYIKCTRWLCSSAGFAGADDSVPLRITFIISDKICDKLWFLTLYACVLSSCRYLCLQFPLNLNWYLN